MLLLVKVRGFWPFSPFENYMESIKSVEYTVSSIAHDFDNVVKYNHNPYGIPDIS